VVRLVCPETQLNIHQRYGGNSLLSINVGEGKIETLVSYPDKKRLADKKLESPHFQKLILVYSVAALKICRENQFA
jgi:hypothetical protein